MMRHVYEAAVSEAREARAVALHVYEAAENALDAALEEEWDAAYNTYCDAGEALEAAKSAYAVACFELDVAGAER